MKNLRRLAPFAAIIMSLNLIFASCAPAPGAEATISAEYSGEEIFRGLFFFQHDIAASIPQLSIAAVEINEIRAEDEEVDQYLSDLAVMTIDYINNHYPSFFEELQTVMYNGDYYQIQEKLNLSEKIIEQAILASEEFSAVYAIGKEISQNPELVAKIQALDLTQESDQKQLEKLLASVEGMTGIDAKARGIAIVNTVAIATNTVVAVTYYHVTTITVTIAACIIVPGPIDLQSGEDELLNEELLIVEVSKFFKGKK